MTASTSRRLSLLTPSGHLTLGNLLGALRGMVAEQHSATCFYGVSDLHALTTAHDPRVLAQTTRELQTLLLAAGLDPVHATLFRQSRVPAHTELAYRTTEVPVGADQRQHVELARGLAQRFNHAYGPVFTVPEVTVPRTGARLMDLADPTRKMSKSDPVGTGVVFLLDPPDVVARKVARAVTDSDAGPDAVRHDPAAKPGVSNLLELLAACTGVTPQATAGDVTTYGRLKKRVTEAALAVLEPLQARYRELAADPAYVDEVFEAGSAHCREVTAPVVAAAREAIGLVTGRPGPRDPSTRPS